MSTPNGDATYLGASHAFVHTSPLRRKRYWYSLPASSSTVAPNEPSFCFFKAMPSAAFQLLKSPTATTDLAVATASFGRLKVTFVVDFEAVAFLAVAFGAVSAIGAVSAVFFGGRAAAGAD